MCIEGFGLATFCNCSFGFSGDHCDNDDNFCGTELSVNCMNNGSCIEGFGTETSCDCMGGFTGDVCEIDLDFCDPDSCFNGGTCIEEIGIQYFYTCADGYSGDRCQTNDNFCDKAPTYRCQNDGTCVEGIGYTTHCVCLDGFSGVDCRLTSGSGLNSIQDLCNLVFGISCTKATIGGVVAIAIGAFFLILFLTTLMLLLVLWCKLRQKKRTYDVAGSPVVGGVMISNPVLRNNIEGEHGK